MRMESLLSPSGGGGGGGGGENSLMEELEQYKVNGMRKIGGGIRWK